MPQRALAKRIVHCRQCGAAVVLCKAPAGRPQHHRLPVDAMPLTNRVFRIDDTVDPPELLVVEDVYQLHNKARCVQLAAKLRGLDADS